MLEPKPSALPLGYTPLNKRCVLSVKAGTYEPDQKEQNR